MKHLLVYRPAAERALIRMDIAPMPSALSGTLKPCRGGHGDSKPLKGALKGRYRPRVGKWRIFVLVATGR